MFARVILATVAGLLLVACSRGEIPGRVRIPAGAIAPPPKDPSSAPRIVSARLAHQREAELGGVDGILVVFSEEIDPASLVPRMLLVVSKAGHRMPPERALLSPAGFGRTRSVLLVGDFTKEGREPSDVIVVGPLYTAGGTSMRGLSHAIESPDAPRRVVGAQRLPVVDTRCEGAAQVVRTYWSTPVRPDEQIELGGIRVGLHDGTEVVPASADAGEAEAASRRGNNVIDLCVQADSAARHLRLDAGVLHDAAGVEVAVREAPAEAW